MLVIEDACLGFRLYAFLPFFALTTFGLNSVKAFAYMLCFFFICQAGQRSLVSREKMLRQDSLVYGIRCYQERT